MHAILAAQNAALWAEAGGRGDAPRWGSLGAVGKSRTSVWLPPKDLDRGPFPDFRWKRGFHGAERRG